MVLQNTFNPNTRNVTDFNYWFLAGTSMATPHVAGTAALLLAAGADRDQARQLLRDTARDLGPAGYDSEYGYGRIDAGAALHALLQTDTPPAVLITAPLAGATVAGTVAVQADARDDRAIVSVEFFVDGASLGTDLDGSNGWGVNWDTSTGADGTRSLAAVAIDTAGQTASDTISVTVANTAPPALHVGDLDGVVTTSSRGWQAAVTVAVHDLLHAPVAGATVSIAWSGAAKGTASAVTGANGLCTFTSPNLNKKAADITLTVTGVSATGCTYDATANHDPDGDSDGTRITVSP
jgi:hypothetical protein